ncbi:MAG: hypothetical protein AAB116_07160, partial [Candidatus Poribacteria bacterium]
ILIISFIGCAASKQPLSLAAAKSSLENKGLLNLALVSNGAKVTVSEENPDHPASTLINGITSSENWDSGEGWEVKNDSVVVDFGQEFQNPLSPIEAYDPNDPSNPSSYGIRVQANNGMANPLGWVVIELPEKKTVNRMVVYTIDSEKYPASKFGVSHLLLQYWTEATLESEVTGWKVVDRIDNSKGQTGNIIRDNKSGVISIRFAPVKTQKMRLAIWWTNDSKFRSHQFLNGTVRLTEVEIYGYEREKKVETALNKEAINDNDVAEIKVVLDTYVDGYNEKNINILMSCISPEYSQGGETCLELKKRMVLIFAENEQAKLVLQDIKVKQTDNGAIATANYESIIDDSTNVANSGIATFSLSKATGFWKIVGIDK